MEPTSKIYVAGHRGMVGSAIVRELQRQGSPVLSLRVYPEQSRGEGEEGIRLAYKDFLENPMRAER